MGPRIQLVTDLTVNKDYSLMKAEVPVTLMVVSTVKMGEFFNEVGRPAETVPPGPPALEALQHFVKVAIAYGYWLGTPEDNASIGIHLG